MPTPETFARAAVRVARSAPQPRRRRHVAHHRPRGHLLHRRRRLGGPHRARQRLRAAHSPALARDRSARSDLGKRSPAASTPFARPAHRADDRCRPNGAADCARCSASSPSPIRSSTGLRLPISERHRSLRERPGLARETMCGRASGTRPGSQGPWLGVIESSRFGRRAARRRRPPARAENVPHSATWPRR